MTPGAKAAFTIWGLAWLWDFFVLARKMRGNTISEAVAQGLNGKYRWLVAAAIFVNVAHVFHLAEVMRRATK